MSNDAIQVEFPAELMWPEETKADAELSLQKVIVDLASKSGMKATTFNNTLTKRNAQRAIASFNIEMEGVLDDAYAFLAGLEAHQPKIAVGNLRIRPGQLRTGPAKQGVVRVQVDLWIYWSSDA
ncbi:GspMb/PilO family protein [Ruegeria sp.]|uniref:GspMb/PilO family protein n=1 Tax=Ruegeria sp. TaxID=1879320 RepID=UPI003C7AE712